MGDADPSSETHRLRGPVDRAALIAIRDLATTEEPLATAELDDYLNPTTLEIEMADGLLGARAARIDVQWTTQNDYKFHYTDSEDVNVRWGRHPHDGDYHVGGLAHYHPPPDASSAPDAVEASCISHTTAELVTRTVRKLWRSAYHADSLVPLNSTDGST